MQPHALLHWQHRALILCPLILRARLSLLLQGELVGQAFKSARLVLLPTHVLVLVWVAPVQVWARLVQVRATFARPHGLAHSCVCEVPQRLGPQGVSHALVY